MSNSNKPGPVSTNSRMFPDYSFNEGLETDDYTDTTHTAEFSSSGSSEEDFSESTFSCSYCKCKDYNSLARCRNCNKYFCNNKIGVKSSHIVNHLTSAQHNTISLHPDSLHGEKKIACMFKDCAVENLFLLSVVAKSEDAGTVLISCSGHSAEPLTPQNFQPALGAEQDFQRLKEAIPLTGNKQIYGAVLQPSTKEYIDKNCIQTEDIQISVLESRWAGDEEATIEGLVSSVATFKPIKVRNKYLSPTHYRDIYRPLVELEREADRRSRSLLNRANIRVDVREFREDVEFSFDLASDGMAGVVFKSKVQLGDDVVLYSSSGGTKDSSENEEAMTGSKEGFRSAAKRKRKFYGDSVKCFITRVYERSKIKCRPYNRTAKNLDCLSGGRGFGKDERGRFFTGNVEFVWVQTCFDRMTEALYKFSHEEDVSRVLTDTLLGQVSPRSRSARAEGSDAPPGGMKTAKGLPALNYYQSEAMRNALRNKFTLIQGPPGTGKTTLSANIVYNFALQSRAKLRQELQNAKKNRSTASARARERAGKVLVCAPSNCAVDHIAEKLSRADAGLKVVRIYAKIKESSALSPTLQQSTLHIRVAEALLGFCKDTLKLDRKRKAKKSALEVAALIKELHREAKGSENPLLEFAGKLRACREKKLQGLYMKCEKQIVKGADVICCTCVTAGRRQIAKYACEYVLIDESSQSTEPESLIPLMNGAQKVVMVGDHYQLGPVVVDNLAAKSGFQQTLFERLTKLGMEPFVLRIQYRMHPEIIRYSNRAFYRGILESGVGREERTLPALKTFFPNRDMPVFFKTCFEQEEISPNGTSYLNRKEARLVLDMVGDLLARGLSAGAIGVITPYDGQRRLLSEMIEAEGVLPRGEEGQLEVDSVDAFQGREKDVMIISCVRSNPYKSIGFLADYRRLNVAITRARYGNVVIGNPKLLVVNKLWRSFVGFFELHGLVVDEAGNAASERYAGVENEEELYQGVEDLVKVRQYNRREQSTIEHYYTVDGETSGQGVEMRSEYSEHAWTQDSDVDANDKSEGTGWDVDDEDEDQEL